MNRLDRLVREHYAQAALPEARVRAILERAQAASPANRIWYLRMGAVAAALVLVFAFVLEHRDRRDTTERVLAEIAMNHDKALAVEVPASDFASLRAAMDRIDFPIRPPEEILGGYTLIGARYCSIQGGIAAQVKLRALESGRVDTLYATALTPELAEIGARSAVHDGVRIRLWSEDGVFFGLAGDAER